MPKRLLLTRCAHICHQIPLISPHNGSLLHFDQFTSIALLLQANTPLWQTSKCSSWVDAGHFGASVDFMSPLAEPPSRPQQLCACQTIAHGWPGSLRQPSRKSSDFSHISDGLNARRRMSSSRVPLHASVWSSARAKAARTMPISPSKLAATIVCPPAPLLSPQNGPLQLFDRDASIALFYCKAKHSAMANFKML